MVAEVEVDPLKSCDQPVARDVRAGVGGFRLEGDTGTVWLGRRLGSVPPAAAAALGAGPQRGLVAWGQFL